MKISITTNSKIVVEGVDVARKQMPFAISLTLNKLALMSKDIIQSDMRSKFDRPTPFFLNSLRLKPATKTKFEAEIAFKDRPGAAAYDNPLALPHVDGGSRTMKPMERRLQRAGYLPKDWQVVPGGGAKLDAYGNMSRGQITQLLNVLGTYTESGYNKANAKTVARLKKGTKKNYGFVYWINYVSGPKHVSRLQPGVYQRVATPFGSSLKPILIFTRKGLYKQRLSFNETIKSVVDSHADKIFVESFNQAMSTARHGDQIGLN